MPARIRTAVASMATTAAAVGILLGSPVTAGADDLTVYVGVECLDVRVAPSLTASITTCVVDGSVVEMLGAPEESEGLEWQQVNVNGATGWVPVDTLGAQAAPRSGSGSRDIPPAGGLAVTTSEQSSLEALIAAQPFKVARVTMFDVARQTFLTYAPDAPVYANTLTSNDLHPGALVFIRRAGSLDPARDGEVAAAGSASPSTDTAGTAIPFTAPPPGGLTTGRAGTNDLQAIADAQTFEVRSISAWDEAAQRWLTYVVGAPASASSLTPERLSPDQAIFIRRASPPAPAVEGPRSDERITYYFCQRGSNVAGWGDGGGFCGHMRNGEIVHSGAAACARSLLGTRFRIEGDPTERIYTCTDTGSGVGYGHRDIWFATSDEGMRWARQVGPRGTVITLP